jgi:hypothetical protein
MDHRRFYLERDDDATGVSGTGRVADGVEFPDGRIAMRWRGEDSSTTVWDRIEQVSNVHGHNGLTRVVWLD